MRLAFILVWLALAWLCGCEARLREEHSYDQFGAATTLLVERPRARQEAAPAVMLVHGGGWTTGSPDELAGVGAMLADEGFVVANIRYRLAGQGGEYPRDLHDCRCALAWLRRHAPELGADPERIAVLGYSAGGHLASLLALARPSVAPGAGCDEKDFRPPSAAVVVAAPQDLAAMAWAPQVRALMGASLEEAPDRYREATPFTHASPAAPPFLILHGTADWHAPLSHALALRDSLRGHGHAPALVILEGAGHTVQPTTTGGLAYQQLAIDLPEARQAVLRFLSETAR